MKKEKTFNQVKISGKGYLVDGIFVPKDEGNRNYQTIKKWIENYGIVADEFTIDDIKDKKIIEIKREAKNIIMSVYNDVKQRNILMSQDRSKIDEMNIFIKKIRDTSNVLKKQITDMDLEHLNIFDPKSNDNWS